jgi:hypothetical protein
VTSAETAQTGPFSNEQLLSLYERLFDYQPCYLPPRPPSITPPGFTSREPTQPQVETVFEQIVRLGHDEDFDPNQNVLQNFLATDAPAGTQEKIEVLRTRVEKGQPLWHNDDRVDWSGLSNAIGKL